MSVIFAEIGVPVKVGVVRKTIFENGERGCVVVDSLGMPLYYPNLFLTTQIRNGSRSASTVSNNAGHLCAFLQVMEEAKINLVTRLSEGKVLEPFEVEALRGDLHRRLSPEPKQNSPITYFSQSDFVSKAVMHARVGVSTRYLEWLASLFLRKPLDPNELARVLAAMKDIRPINKRRNNIKRRRGLDAVTALAFTEALRPGSEYNIWLDPAIQVRNRLMLSLMYELGIRRGELLNLKIEDFNFKANQVEIIRRADEKSDPRIDQPLVKTNDRIIPVKATLMDEVRFYLTRCRNLVPRARRHGFLIVTHKAGPTQGNPISIANYKDVIHSLRTAVPPLSKFSGHDLRHYWNERFSDLMDKAGIPPAEEELIRSELMGWRFGSGTAATYNRRYIERKAAEYGMNLQSDHLKAKGVPK
ncbi:site-specific integrase [Xanthomonas sp. WHRI 1810A]|uniref:tyrosine-type recombinase/integrase n=1 Tax=Xanthomonas sp. WHRI 1810A TaxID=3161565 RepID=UPI0032E8B89E